MDRITQVYDGNLIKQKLLEDLPFVLSHLLPAGKHQGQQYVVGNIEGEPGNSLVIELAGDKAGLWYDFATDEGGDIIDLWGHYLQLDSKRDFAQIIRHIANWLGCDGNAAVKREQSNQVPASLAQHTQPTQQWKYHGIDGRVLAIVYRFEDSDGSKRYLPFDPSTQTYTAPKVRPLYNLPAFMSASAIILVEGEKCAQALIDCGLVASTAMNGSKAPLDKTDWTAFIGKNVIIWPDNDDSGKDYAQRIAQFLYEIGALGIAILQIPSDKPPKWDAADAVAEGWTPMMLETFIRQHCRPYEFDGISPKEKQCLLLPPCLAERSATLDDFLTRYVYVAEGDRVCDLLSPAHCSLYKFSEFKNMTANCLQEVPAPTKSNPDKTRLDKMWYQWLSHPQRKNARGACYQPGQERLFKGEHGLYWVNEFHLPEFKATHEENKLDVFFEHMRYLFPIECECEWFIDWMAFNLQYPQRRCKVTPLHVSVAHGTGRGWLVALMAKLLGDWNCKKTKMHVLCGEYSQYHEYLHNSLLCAVEEVKDSDKRYTVADSIRDLLTEDYLEVNLKYGFKRTQPVMTNFFFMSNHPDALVLTTEDRRINVFRGPDQPKSNEYYTQLYNWLSTEGIGQLYHYLLRRNIQQFNWQRAMDNEAKHEMIENNRTQTESLFWELMEDPTFPVGTFQQIKRELYLLSGCKPFELQLDERQLLKLLQKHCKQDKPIKIKGEKYRPWLLGKQAVLLNKEAMRAYLAARG